MDETGDSSDGKSGDGYGNGEGVPGRHGSAHADRPPRQMNDRRHAVEVVPDAASLATRAAEWLIEQIGFAIGRRGRAVIALSGGSTPRAVFACLAEPPWRDRIAWDKVHVFWGDDRFVPADDDASNARMARIALLDRVELPASHVYPIPSDEGSTGDGEDAIFERARRAAALYATTLHAFYGGNRLHDDRLLFDVVLLGIGDDGHTASLFPGGPELDERDAWVVPSKTTNPPAPIRVTLTYPALQSTHAALFLVAGAGKRDMARRALAGDADLPSARYRAAGGTLWILDEAAGG